MAPHLQRPWGAVPLLRLLLLRCKPFQRQGGARRLALSVRLFPPEDSSLGPPVSSDVHDCPNNNARRNVVGDTHIYNIYQVYIYIICYIYNILELLYDDAGMARVQGIPGTSQTRHTIGAIHGMASALWCGKSSPSNAYVEQSLLAPCKK